jgi:hypothetical protein
VSRLRAAGFAFVEVERHSEAAKYAERRDDIGRLMLSALLQARRRVAP